MLTITDYVPRQNAAGKDYFALELTSDVPEMVISKTSNRYYMTIRKCYIPATFPEAICKAMIGRQMPGSIVRRECEAYDFTVAESGESLTLNHRYEYSPAEAGTLEEAVFQQPALV